MRVGGRQLQARSAEPVGPALLVWNLHFWCRDGKHHSHIVAARVGEHVFVAQLERSQMKTRKLVFAVVVSLGAVSGVHATTLNLGRTDGESRYFDDTLASTSSFAGYVKSRLAGHIPSATPSFADLSARKYRWELAGVAGSQSGFWDRQMRVAAVPAADAWSMSMIGLGLVGYQLRRKQRSLKQPPFAV
jgi:hypothetical protein